MGNVSLPDDVVERFKGKTMAITGFEMDWVMDDQGQDVSVPINWAYNHHFEASASGVDVSAFRPILRGLGARAFALRPAYPFCALRYVTGEYSALVTNDHPDPNDHSHHLCCSQTSQCLQGANALCAAWSGGAPEHADEIRGYPDPVVTAQATTAGPRASRSSSSRAPRTRTRL